MLRVAWYSSLIKAFFGKEVVNITQLFGMRVHDARVDVTWIQKLTHSIGRKERNALEVGAHLLAVQTLISKHQSHDLTFAYTLSFFSLDSYH